MMAGAEHAIGECVGDQPLVIVGEDQSIQLFQRGKKLAKKFFFKKRSDRFPALVVDTDNLLMARNHTCFYGCDARFISDDSLVNNSGGAKTSAKGFARLVFANQSKSFNARSERGKIRGDIAGAAQAFTL